MSEADVIREALEAQRAYSEYAADSVTRERCQAALAALARLEAERDEAIRERSGLQRECLSGRAEIAIERHRTEAAEERSRSRLLAEALSEIEMLVKPLVGSRGSRLGEIARAALAGSAAPSSVECDGGPYCKASRHIHGCFADKGNCDHPSEHGAAQAVDRTLEGER